MVTDYNFKSGMSLIFSTFPHLKPTENADFVLKVWHKAFNSLTDEQFVSAVSDFAINTKKLYPSDNWVAMVLDRFKPKVTETVGDIVELIMNVIGSVSFLYPNEQTQIALNNLKAKSPIAYAVGTRLGWREMATSENMDVLRGQIRAIAEQEVTRANETGSIAPSAKDVVEDGGELIPLIQRISKQKLLK